jgi:hypothetical protein
MDNNVGIVQQQPAGVYTSLAVMGQDTVFLQRFFDFVANGANLSGAFAGADNKIVRKAAYLTDIQQNYIACLLIAGDIDGAAG